jgi:PAS domain S-box-containing protein
MDDHLKTTDQLLAELTQLRERVAELETASAARVQAEIALRDSATRLRHLTDNMLDVVGLTDRRGVFQYISPSIKTLAGYEPSEIVSRSMFEHVHPGDRYHLNRISMRALRTGQTGRMELRYQHADGHYMTLEAVGTPARDSTGYIIGGVMSARDITERKQAEEQLRLAQLTYLGILNSVTEAIYIQSDDGVFQYVNQAAERLYGYTAAEFIGQTPEFLSAPGKNDLAAVAAQVHDAYAGTPRQFEFWGRRRDGSIFPKEVSVTPGSYFGKRVVIAVARDITARQQTEQALRDSEEKYRTILDNIEDGYYEVDLSGNFTFFNEALRHMLGYPADQLMGLNDRQYTDPVNARKLYEAFLRVYQTGEPATGFDWEIIRKDGAVRIVDASVSLIHDPAGQATGFRGIVRDITARKQAEEQLQRYEFIVNAADEFMTLINRQHVLEAVNDAYCRAQARSRAELIGRSLAEVWGEARYREKIVPYVEQCFAGQIVRYEDTFAFESGEPRQYQVGMYPYTPASGGPVTYAAIVTVDVTERVRAEMALRDNEARLRRAESVAHFGNWEFHLTEGKVRASAGARLIYGLQGDEWSIPDVQALSLPEYRPLLDAALAALIEHQTPYDVEFLIRRPDGELRDIHALAEYDPVSRTVFGVISDITEHKRIEQAERDQRTLADSLREVAILLNSTLDYSTVLDQMLLNIGRVVPHTTANVMIVDEAAGLARVVRARGYGEQGRGLAEQVLRLSLSLMLRNLRTMYETHQPAIMNDTRNSPDWVVTPETAWTRSYLGAPIVLRDRLLGFLNLDSDQPNFFTEEHARRLMAFAAQAAAAIENARLFEAEHDARQLAEALRDTATTLNSSLDPDSVLDQILINVERVVPNEGANIMLIDGDRARVARANGRCAVESIGRENHAINDTGNLHTMLTTGEPCIVDRTRDNPAWHVLPGHEWVASYAGAPIRVHGEVLGFLGLYSSQPGFFSANQAARLRVFADQVALAVHNAQLHSRMQLYAEELEERVSQRTRELSATNDQLAAANARLTQLDQLKDQFISRISHELRTPLTNIKIYLELLETGKADKRPKYLATLSAQAARLHELIEDLLEVSQLDMAHLTLNLRPFDLNHVATELLSDKQSAARERDLTLVTDLQAELPAAFGESSLTFQAAERLMVNALAYTPRGGHVTIKTAQQQQANSEWVTLTIQDTGPGISDKDLPHLFERFYRGDAASDYTVPGTGLGLSISQAVIKKMAGQITVENVPATNGGGAAFTIWLRCAEQAKQTG